MKQVDKDFAKTIVAASLSQERESFFRENICTNEDELFEHLSSLHPEDRAVKAPMYLIKNKDEIIQRYEHNHYLPEGFYFDPIKGTFFFIQTID